MTRRKKSFSIPVAFVVLCSLGTYACTDHFDDLNAPKDSLTSGDVDGSLLGQAFAQSQFHSLYGGSIQTSQNLFADEYAQYFTTTEANFDSGQFFEVRSWTNGRFNGFYSLAAPQQKFVEDFTAENDMAVENAVAKIWRAHSYHRWTDYFGPLMYSEFGNGETHVPYDSQEFMYKDFFRLLDEAVAVLEANPGASAFAEDDQIYGGNTEQWRLFANSLRLRLAVRLAYVEPELARSEAEKAVAAGVILDNEDNAELFTTPNSLNGYSAITYIDEFRMTSNWESLMLGYDDPRISEYFEPAADGSGYSGIRPGLSRTEKGTYLNDENSFIDTKWRPLEVGGVNMPEKLLRASEVYFLRAEGALRGWDMGGTPEDLYNEGIRASIEEYTTASPERIDTYIANTDLPIAPDDVWGSPPVADIPVAYMAGADFEKNLEQIITQKWIALYPNGWEAWTERRRTGYPVGYAVRVSLHPDIARDELFRRMTFTNNERANNARAVEEAEGLLQGPDANDTRLWWDAKPLQDYITPID